MKRGGQIGFSQRIHLDWLEYTANLVLAGNPREEIVAALGERLKEKLSVGNQPERGNRDKAITILTKVWVTVPREFQRCCEARHRRPVTRRLGNRSATKGSVTFSVGARAIGCWCTGACVWRSIPFSERSLTAVGRLLHLQGTAGAAQVQRRLRERFGERETVARAARRILRVYIDWGVLMETGEKGLYHGAAKRVIDDPSLAVWAIKAMLFAAGDNPRSVSVLLRGPHLFPFDVVLPSMRELEACEALEIFRHGLDKEVLLGLSKQDGAHGVRAPH